MATDKRSFERSLEKLEKIVEELEGGEFSLEESLDKFEQGLQLGHACKTILEKADTRVKMLVEDDAGESTRKDAADDLQNDV